MSKKILIIVVGTLVVLAATLGCSHLWRTDGNSGTIAGTNYLGTNDNEALEVKVGEKRALRIEPGPTPNIIGGHPANNVSSKVYGAFIGGGGDAGEPNWITEGGIYASIGGGLDNRVDGNFATIGGGWGNLTAGGAAVIAGGTWNQSNGITPTIGGGTENLAIGDYSTICGGGHNETGGHRAVVAGGAYNQANGNCSMIPGGSNNKAEGEYSFAAGRRARAAHHGAFVWGDHNQKDISSTGSDQFVVRASGGVWFYTNPDATTGVNLPAGSGSWSSVSDRNLKDNFSEVDGDEILAKIASLPISSWNYRSQDPSIRHMGPVAQDFHAAFGLGADDKSISTVDASGVALAAIQALYAQNQEKEAEVAELRAELENLEKRLQALENDSK